MSPFSRRLGISNELFPSGSPAKMLAEFVIVLDLIKNGEGYKL
jgi:hypothetical protein